MAGRNGHGILAEVDDSGRRILLTVSPPDRPEIDDNVGIHTVEKPGLSRVPLDFILVIDVSGSTAAQAPGPSAGNHPHLCVLDVVKYAAKSICVSMGPQDRLAIVSFSGRAKIDLPWTYMDAQRKQSTLIAIDQLQPQDRSNLWDGLKTALDLVSGIEQPEKSTEQIFRGSSSAGDVKEEEAKARSEPFRRASIFLLAHGLLDPELEPYRGLAVELEMHIRDLKRSIPIHTFGIGSVIHSSLLHEISSITGGRFTFVSDASKVGDVVTHTLANEFATFADDLRIELTVDGGDAEILKDVEVVGWPGSAPFTYPPRRKVTLRGKTSFGPLVYGETRHFVLDFGKDVRSAGGLRGSLNFRVRLRLRSDNSEQWLHFTGGKSDADPPSRELFAHSTRLAFVNLVAGLSTSRAPPGGPLAGSPSPPSHLVETVESLKREIQARLGKEGRSVALDEALLADLHGSVSQLLSDGSTYKRWGLHNLLSLANAHHFEQRSSSEDPGVQLYGTSEYFQDVKAEVAKAVEALGPPRPSARRSAIYGGTRGLKTFPQPARPPSPPRQTLSERFREWYNRPEVVCFDGECRVELANGTTLKVGQVKIGAEVRTAVGKSAVVGVLQTVVEDGALELVQVSSGLWITPWHPVRLDADHRWRFPVELAQPKLRQCGAVYSLVLERDTNPEAHTVHVGGVCCATLGHGVGGEATEDPRAHPFFSDYDAITEAVDAAPSCSRIAGGAVRMVGLTRDPSTGLANGFRWVPAKHALED